MKDATTDPDQIREQWTQWPPANIGIATGHGLYVVDIDGNQGRGSLVNLEAGFGPLSPTLTSKTGRGDGGEHRVFRVPCGVALGNAQGETLGLGIDGRGDDGYIVAPPSLHRSGRRYRWEDTSVPIADLPEALVRYLSERPSAHVDSIDAGARRDFEKAAAALADHDREQLTRQAEGRLNWAVDMLSALPHEAGNARGDAFFRAACFVGAGVGAGVLHYERAIEALEDCASRLRLSRSHQAWRSIRNGLARGAAEPLTPRRDISSISFRSSSRAHGWPQPVGEAAFHGVAGDVVRLIEPHSEADPAALLVQFVTCVGNALGRSVRFRVEADDHYCNTYTVLVGDTSKGRKGVSFSHARRPVEMADPSWAERVLSGGSSGEGLIHALRDLDPDEQFEALDKRLLLYEPEFASILRRMKQEGNTLSTILRQAWDSGNLATLTKHDPLQATDAHLSVVAHITRDELGRDFNVVETANGFGNRFLWVCVGRSKILPFGGDVGSEDWAPIVTRVTRALNWARQRRRVVDLSSDARVLWNAEYERLSEGHPGVFGAITSRAEAQVRRLALIYAALDCSTTVKAVHLRAALAVWDYAERSARYLWGDAVSPVATRILNALRESPDGLTLTAISHALGRNVQSHDIQAALQELRDANLASFRTDDAPKQGRPATRWCATTNETKLTKPTSSRESKQRKPRRRHT